MSQNEAYSFTPIVETANTAVPSHGIESLREPKTVDNQGSTADRYAAALAKVTGTAQNVSQHSINENAKSPAEPGKPVESVQLSPQMAALARKEHKFRQADQDLKARETALEARMAKLAKLEEMEARLANKDYSGIESLVDYNSYTDYLINKETATSPEQQAFKKLSDDLEGVKKAQQDDVSKRFDAAVSERRNAVNSLVESNLDFSTIKELKMQEHVVQHILDTWEHDNIDLSPEQAAKEVEELLVEKANKWANLSKVKPKVAVKELPIKPAVKTLTNNMQATGEIKRTPKSMHSMSDSERWAEARRRVEEKQKLDK